MRRREPAARPPVDLPAHLSEYTEDDWTEHAPTDPEIPVDLWRRFVWKRERQRARRREARR